ncbi:MAG TPA: glycosyltransferase family 9 protein, partial [Candidatus Limnocylindrales bacterium]|nr:glycosyltransferase family 9 protein [Candidatus Limnocylindrales bacterium]
GHSVVFNTGGGPRERELLAELTRLIPNAPALSPALDRAVFLAALKRARVFISGDTGPLHFAAGLGVPTISLFGPTSPARWAPVGKRHQILTGGVCGCDGNSAVCTATRPCLAEISPEQVFAALPKAFAAK